jgi:cytochrome c6
LIPVNIRFELLRAISGTKIGPRTQFLGGIMKKRRVRKTGALLLAGALALLFSVPSKADDAAATFKAKCAACHGADGSGNTAVGKSLHMRALGSADVQKLSDAELTSMITDGKGAMPAYKDKLTADQIKQLVGFIRQLGKKP